MKTLKSILSTLTILPFATPQSNLAAHIPNEYTYLLPRPFNNTFTQPFVDTNTSNPTVSSQLSRARNSSFISYSPEFDSILGPSPEVRLTASSPHPFAFEGGAWVPELNQIWFTAFLNPPPGYLTILDIATSKTFRPNLTGPAADVPINPNGAYYFDGLVYLTSFGDTTTSPTIVSIDPHTYETREVINSFFGLPLNGPDDVTLARSRTTGYPCLFYSDFFFAVEGLAGTWPGPQEVPNAVYRYTFADESLQMVISPLDIQTPNGLAVNRDNTLLYVSDGPDSAVFGQPYNSTSGTPGLYVFDLGGVDGCTPMNKRLLSIARQGFVNGIKIDDYGRIWEIEYEGVIVRSQTGKVLGVFNVVDIVGTDGPDVATGANFALAKDELFIFGFQKIYAVKLGKTVKTWY
ncbi:hypothetical protein PRZ48_002980 [Zasmidium cellare]|uniref:SMP-30/Gluconolactonase/LRE-like region domain-containing protein n=1 Tax=Zasmidium cellare TaxID=395010 RepID=A0ABR0ETW5_ZASCE|nr:hypothetical protein PRZ48_002980 [Zasmidium cellare]